MPLPEKPNKPVRRKVPIGAFDPQSGNRRYPKRERVLELGLDPSQMADYDYEQGRIENAYWNKTKRSTPASSQVKKAKMSPRKLGQMGAGINSGLGSERSKILGAIRKLPMAQQKAIYKALQGYAMD